MQKFVFIELFIDNLILWWDQIFWSKVIINAKNYIN